MAKAKDIKKEAAEQAVSESLSRTETFFKTYAKHISIGFAVVIVAVALGFIYYQWIYTPKVQEAEGQAARCEFELLNGDYEIALKGDGASVMGFENVINKYGSKAPKSVYFSAGVCAYEMGDYQLAVDYLKKYDGEDPTLAAAALAKTAAAYVGLEDYKAALSCYAKAAAKANNDYAAGYLLNAGVIAETLGQYEEAVGYYRQIEEKYPMTIEAMDVAKYISRAETAAAQAE